MAAAVAAAVAAFATPRITSAAVIAFIDVILIIYLDLIIKIGFFWVKRLISHPNTYRASELGSQVFEPGCRAPYDVATCRDSLARCGQLPKKAVYTAVVLEEHVVKFLKLFDNYI
jgi:hypothetical protein